MKVADLMGPTVTILTSRSVREAAILLARAGTSIAPVVSSEGTYQGLFAEADVHRRLSEAIRGFHSPGEFRTGVPFMGGPLPDGVWRRFGSVGWLSVGALVRRIRPISPEDSVAVALEAIQGHGLSAVPVVMTGEIVGILHSDALTRPGMRYRRLRHKRPNMFGENGIRRGNL